MTSKILHLPKNVRGRDFVVGDLHFKIQDLQRGLQALGFDQAIDRLIAVGDVIDRGPGVREVLQLLDEPWFYSVQGNHEQMLINAYHADPDVRYAAHAMVWWPMIPYESKSVVIEKLRSLPIAIEIESAQGIVGVVHADVPAGVCWQTFVAELENPAIEETALWGRDRIMKHQRDGVPGAWRVCTGHSWIPRPLRLGNVLALDITGGCDGSLAIYCVQDDTIYIDGIPASLDQAERLSDLLAALSEKSQLLKDSLNSNKLIEAQIFAAEVDTIVKLVSTMWMDAKEGLVEQQQFINALHGVSLSKGSRRGAKLDALCSQHTGSQTEGLLRRLINAT
ncbi:MULTISPECIES: serine/threonine protein phosphatase [Pseudomonas]|jgi:serine/threonine protein phosphatase 1|uniref:Serine/threonine protein phosphatase n=1 Tax=Pseudomonas putida (strain ATCC 47054 / DSM 6125 / CFBP 8728 / NCIMB 11950 / KT2440) TaxID=160488 RepID=Q88GN2_PSEPK|nr:MULTISPECIES: serine/threonine protein phosphatase [Pseudomonas]AAN69286.1 putative Serine/threonine protein phosphatase [Pseudomonas putida KT2440]KMU97133.1 serine/threonine protein phosphatase [Pseudomonas putida]KMY30936.1 serine/threonine protein phosphatase [Pseudomonas putida]MDD2079550.1 serine/threonine protein phosphatase [Pseudomonas putida]PXZ50289.1 serine/threonine protein phosphatase [Pseudomonas sp. SMT-1]